MGHTDSKQCKTYLVLHWGNRLKIEKKNRGSKVRGVKQESRLWSFIIHSYISRVKPGRLQSAHPTRAC